MSILDVKAIMNGEEYQLSEEEERFERDIPAPERSSPVAVVATDESQNSSETIEYIEVYGEWLPPKTDWVASDYINYIDYNRIKNNMAFSYAFASLMYNVGNRNVGDDKDYESYIYADEINDIENGLEVLDQKTYSFGFEKREWFPNQKTLSYEDLNRIEGFQLRTYQTLVAQRNAQNKLSFRLGGQKGIRV